MIDRDWAPRLPGNWGMNSPYTFLVLKHRNVMPTIFFKEGLTILMKASKFQRTGALRIPKTWNIIFTLDVYAEMQRYRRFQLESEAKFLLAILLVRIMTSTVVRSLISKKFVLINNTNIISQYLIFLIHVHLFKKTKHYHYHFSNRFI